MQEHLVTCFCAWPIRSSCWLVSRRSTWYVLLFGRPIGLRCRHVSLQRSFSRRGAVRLHAGCRNPLMRKMLRNLACAGRDRAPGVVFRPVCPRGRLENVAKNKRKTHHTTIVPDRRRTSRNTLCRSTRRSVDRCQHAGRFRFHAKETVGVQLVVRALEEARFNPRIRPRSQRRSRRKKISAFGKIFCPTRPANGVGQSH